MKTKRNTKQRSRRTLVQAVIGSVASWGLVETVIQNVLPVLQQGELRLAAVGALAIVLTTAASTVQNWYENRRPDRATSKQTED